MKASLNINEFGFTAVVLDEKGEIEAEYGADSTNAQGEFVRTDQEILVIAKEAVEHIRQDYGIETEWEESYLA